MEANGAASMGMMILWMVVIFGIMYFLMIRPQKKEQKRLQTMLNEEDVIVEFGNNKNCRIPMRKQAITEVEKAEQATA